LIRAVTQHCSLFAHPSSHPSTHSSVRVHASVGIYTAWAIVPGAFPSWALVSHSSSSSSSLLSSLSTVSNIHSVCGTVRTVQSSLRERERERESKRMCVRVLLELPPVCRSVVQGVHRDPHTPLADSTSRTAPANTKSQPAAPTAVIMTHDVIACWAPPPVQTH